MFIILNRKHILGSIFLFLICMLLMGMIVNGGGQPPTGETAGEKAVYLPIIMYHEIKTFKTGKDVITPYEFESDLKYLRDHDYHAITMTRLIQYVYGDAELPENPIILSFDDGYLNTYKYAFPLLKKYDMKIVFSIIGKNTDDFTQIPDNNLDYSHVTWAQLNEMLNSGYVEVQNHSYNLHSVNSGRIGCLPRRSESAEKYEQVLTADIQKLQDKIFMLTGEFPNTFTYPYGRFSENTEAVIKKLGFQATLSCDYGINKITNDPEILFGLKRVCRSHGYSIKKALKDVLKTIRK